MWLREDIVDNVLIRSLGVRIRKSPGCQPVHQHSDSVVFWAAPAARYANQQVCGQISSVPDFWPSRLPADIPAEGGAWSHLQLGPADMFEDQVEAIAPIPHAGMVK